MENKRTGLIVGIGAGCLMLCLLAVIGGGVWFFQATEPPEGIILDLDVPSEVRINDDLTIEVSIQNSLPESRVLNDIDIDLAYLDGIFIHGSQPAFYDSWDSGGYQTYSFDIDIPPNDTVTILLNATAIQTGTFTGQLEVCVDSGFSCLEYPVHTRVTQQ